MDRTLFIALAVCFVAGALSAEVGVFVDKQEASEFLKRGKRANQPFEEFLQGNWERECVEEQCDYEEVREVYENDDQAAEAWKGLWHQCTYPSEPCSSPGTAECENQYSDHVCHCRSGFTGSTCATDVDECALGHCPEGTECVDGTNRFTCVCPDAGCQAAQSNQVQQQEHP